MQPASAIVLSTSPYSETTLIVRLLTRELGVVRAMAKGARSGKGRTQAAFEPLALLHVNLRLKSPDALGTLGEIRLLQSWPYLRTDLNRFGYAALGAEILAAVAEEAPHEPYYHDETVHFLEQLAEVPGPGSLTLALLIRALHHAGLIDVLLRDPDFAPSTPEFAAALEPFARRIPPLDASFTLPARAGAFLLDWIVRFWESQLDRKLKSWRFVQSLHKS